MYLVMSKEKPSPLDEFEARKVFQAYATSHSYEGEPTRIIKENLLKEESDTLVITADSRLLMFVPLIVPIENVYLYERGKPLRKIQDCTQRQLRVGHNMMKLFEAGEFQ